MLNVNPDTRLTSLELLQENWFLTDQSQKRSHAEIKRQFKAKILNKFPIRNVNKNTICIPMSSGVTSAINKKEKASAIPFSALPKNPSKSTVWEESRSQSNSNAAAASSSGDFQPLNTQQTVISQASPPSYVPVSDTEAHANQNVTNGTNQG